MKYTIVLSVVGVLCWAALDVRADTTQKSVAAVAEPALAALEAKTVARILDAPWRMQGSQTLVDLGGGTRATLGVAPGLQKHAQQLLDQGQVPYGAIVAVDPETGLIRALATRCTAGDCKGKSRFFPALSAEPPAASLVKVVTASALLGDGLTPETTECYRGGSQRLLEHHLKPAPPGSRCSNLELALASSTNVVFARLAHEHLTPAEFQGALAAFGFNERLPLSGLDTKSKAEVPTDALEFARAAAGFWHVHLSPMHAALIATTLARGGQMPALSLVDEVRQGSTGARWVHKPIVTREVMPQERARTLAHMLEKTVTHGTSRRAFRDRRGRFYLPRLTVAGKTGSLCRRDPYRYYSWWMGFAHDDEGKSLALAVLVGNDTTWRVRASEVARDVFRGHFSN